MEAEKQGMGTYAEGASKDLEAIQLLMWSLCRGGMIAGLEMEPFDNGSHVSDKTRVLLNRRVQFLRRRTRRLLKTHTTQLKNIVAVLLKRKTLTRQEILDIIVPRL